VVDGRVVFHDRDHLTVTPGRALLDPLDEILAEEGALDP
jgi:hypothetical protein